MIMNMREQDELVPSGSFWLRPDGTVDAVLSERRFTDGVLMISYTSYRVEEAGRAATQGYGSAIVEAFTADRARIAFVPNWTGVASGNRVDRSLGEHELTAAQLHQVWSFDTRPGLEFIPPGESAWSQLQFVDTTRCAPGADPQITLSYDETDDADGTEITVPGATVLRVRIA